VFGLKEEYTPSTFAFNSASVYGIREDPAKLKGLEFNASQYLLVSLLLVSTTELFYRVG
jgi:hypothetical protein